MKVFVVCAFLGALCSPVALQTKKPPVKPSPSRPKTAATPAKKADESSEWARVTAITERSERIAALEKFATAFSKSAHLSDAMGLIAAARVEAGNDDLAAGNFDAAVTDYNAAIAIVPTPIVQGFWDAGLSKIPTNLYFRSRREDAYKIAKALEAKAIDSSPQLLSLAGFYLAIEDGANAERIANTVIAAVPSSAAAYRILGFAERMEFRLDDSAVAFAKAVEADPNSLDAKQGLAEMKRALGRSDEALTLYGEILAKDPANITAQTGHVLALLDADRRSDAEAEMSKALEEKPKNFLLLGEAAYWYAAHKDGAKAVELAQRAVAIEPRFVWSHIALARGLIIEGKPAEAEATLIAARLYGKFPTIAYELAAARFAAGYYREAAEGLSDTFSIKDGQISTTLGGHVARESKTFIELLGDERRASIFAPTADDEPDTAARLAALLDLQQKLAAADTDEKDVSSAADEFAKGADAMQVHRQLYAASRLLEKKVALPKAIELAKAAVAGVDAGLTVPSVSTAVMASELYMPRATAAARGEFLNVPEVPRATLSAIIRGRIEDVIGWAQYQSGANDEALIHLRRATGVLPADSAWSRTGYWHLGAALAATGNDKEALVMYIKSYKGSQPDAIRYSVIEALYRKVNGSADGLTDKIGDNPADAMRVPSATATPEIATASAPSPTPVPTPDLISAIPIATPVSTPAAETAASRTGIADQPSASPTPPNTPTPGPSRTPAPELAPTPTPMMEASTSPSPTPTPQPSPSPSAEVVATATPMPAAPQEKPASTPNPATQPKASDLFAPVVITIPSAKGDKPQATKLEPSPVPVEDIPSCNITVSSDSLRLNRGGSQAVVVGREDGGAIDGLEASGSPEVLIRREAVTGVSSRALFLIRAAGAKVGLFQIIFKLPCGSKTIDVSIH
jgi:tetratricopeptide (TPR) repeat protein